GVLARSFQHMIEVVRQRTAALEESEARTRMDNQELDRRVRERTVELEHAYEELERALDQAKAANRARDDFLGHMSHDLRSPLHKVLGFSRLLEDAARDCGQEELFLP